MKIILKDMKFLRMANITTSSVQLLQPCGAVTQDTCIRNPWMRTTNCSIKPIIHERVSLNALLCHYTQTVCCQLFIIPGRAWIHTHYPFSTCMPASGVCVRVCVCVYESRLSSASTEVMCSIISVRCSPVCLLWIPVCVCMCVWRR